jgi:hypothetical protein
MQDFQGTRRDYSCAVIMQRLSGRCKWRVAKGIKQESLYLEDRT